MASMHKASKNLFLAAVLLVIAGSLLGCGCDEETGKKCTTAYNGHKTNLAKKDKCTSDGGFNTYSKCIKDAECCDAESGGKTMKTLLGELSTAWTDAKQKDCKNACE